MKKTLALLLALVMLFSLAACGAAEPTPAEPAPAATEEPAATITCLLISYTVFLTRSF